MTLSGRMQRKLRDVGFVNITGLSPHRPLPDGGWVRGGLEGLLGHTCEAVLALQSDQEEALVCVDALVTRESEVWVAPAGTCRVVAVRSLVRKLAPEGYYGDNWCIDFAVKIDDFFRATAPKMNWPLKRERVSN